MYGRYSCPKDYKNSKNLNQVEFSSGLGISQGRLSEIEKDKTKPSADTLIVLKKQFDVDLNWLLSDQKIN